MPMTPRSVRQLPTALAAVAVLASLAASPASASTSAAHREDPLVAHPSGLTRAVATRSSTRWKPTQVTAVPETPGVAYAVEKNLTPRTIAVHRAALRSWPTITTYYGYRNDPTSDHYVGRALDLMIPNYTTASGKALGGKVAAWAVAHQQDFSIQYVIWNQHIWNVSRASEGWRLMADRGSDTANHKNHVHISVM